MFLTLNVYFPYCKTVYKGKGKQLHFQELLRFPSGSLGRHTAEFLQKNQLELMNGYEAHDMKHVLFGIPASMEGEVRMQYFEFGNGNRSLPVITVMFFGTLFMPERLCYFIQEYKRGSLAGNLRHIDLKQYAHLSINQLRNQWTIR